jgi:hypothetical protein
MLHFIDLFTIILLGIPRDYIVVQVTGYYVLESPINLKCINNEPNKAAETCTAVVNTPENATSVARV